MSLRSTLAEGIVNVFRLHIRPKGGLADHDYSVDYCLREGILGAGALGQPGANARIVVATHLGAPSAVREVSRLWARSV
jgi:hypothetical protein